MLKARLAHLRGEAAEAGSATLEYAFTALAAVGLAAVLLKVVTSAKVQTALSGVFERALN